MNDSAPTTPPVGRFAPSPTGALHRGSLVAALGSYLESRSRNGLWFVRIEDLDPPRVVPGAADDILRSLERHGLYWDGEVLYQSTRLDAYADAVRHLLERGLAYPCRCSRKQVEQSAKLGAHGWIYPGTCRRTPVTTVQGHRHALRVLTHSDPVGFDDQLSGYYAQRLEVEVGDFVIRRADGLFAYQLAVVVDDAYQNVTEVVRGADLLDNTPRQIYLQHLLELPTPRYAHLPVVLNAQGQKLSKQTFAPPLDPARASENLIWALRFLDHAPPRELLAAPCETLLAWATEVWSLARLRAHMAGC